MRRSTYTKAAAAIVALTCAVAASAQPFTRLSVTPAPEEGTSVATLDYFAPRGDPTGRRYIQPTPSSDALAVVTRNAAAIGASVSTVEDEDGDALIVVYLGDPREFVDCGVILATSQTGQEQRIEAARDAMTLDIRRGPEAAVVETKRWMLIAARTTIRMERRAGPPFFAIAQSTYVLTKIVSARVDDGDFLGRTVETISFPSGASAAFDKGTECQPTGQLEQSLLANL